MPDFTSERVGEPSIDNLYPIKFVNRYFYASDGRRSASKVMNDGSILVSSLAPVAVQRLAIADSMAYLKRRRSPQLN